MTTFDITLQLGPNSGGNSSDAVVAQNGASYLHGQAGYNLVANTASAATRTTLGLVSPLALVIPVGPPGFMEPVVEEVYLFVRPIVAPGAINADVHFETAFNASMYTAGGQTPEQRARAGPVTWAASFGAGDVGNYVQSPNLVDAFLQIQSVALPVKYGVVLRGRADSNVSQFFEGSSGAGADAYLQVKGTYRPDDGSHHSYGPSTDAGCAQDLSSYDATAAQDTLVANASSAVRTTIGVNSLPLSASIPTLEGMIIRAAWFTIGSPNALESLRARIHYENELMPQPYPNAVPADALKPEGRNRSATSVEFIALSQAANQLVYSPSILPLINELVVRPGWNRSMNLGFILRGFSDVAASLTMYMQEHTNSPLEPTLNLRIITDFDDKDEKNVPTERLRLRRRHRLIVPPHPRCRPTL